MKSAVCVMVTAALLVCAGMVWSPRAAMAAADSEGPGLFGAMLKGRIASLQLSDQQKVELKSVLKAHWPTLQPLVSEYVSERRALRSLTSAEQVDEAAIRAQVGRIAAVESNLSVERAYVMRDCRAILTPDQIARLRKMQEKRQAMIDRFLARVAGAAQ